MTAGAQAAPYSGRCRGGPLDGRPGTSRFPAGFILVDRAAGLVWYYDRAYGDAFIARDPVPYDADAIAMAAHDAAWDVRAAPDPGGGA